MGRISSGAPTSAAAVHHGSVAIATPNSATSEIASRAAPVMKVVQIPCTAWVSPWTRSISAPGGLVWKNAPSSVSRWRSRSVCIRVATPCWTEVRIARVIT